MTSAEHGLNVDRHRQLGPANAVAPCLSRPCTTGRVMCSMATEAQDFAERNGTATVPFHWVRMCTYASGRRVMYSPRTYLRHVPECGFKSQPKMLKRQAHLESMSSHRQSAQLMTYVLDVKYFAPSNCIRNIQLLCLATYEAA